MNIKPIHVEMGSARWLNAVAKKKTWRMRAKYIPSLKEIGVVIEDLMNPRNKIELSIDLEGMQAFIDECERHKEGMKDRN